MKKERENVLRKYVVIGRVYNENKRKAEYFYYYVEANNKMDAARSFKEKCTYLNGWTMDYDQEREESVWEYEEPVFHEREDCYDGWNG